MKKVYNYPNLKIVKISTYKMLGNSLGVYSSEVDGSSALGRGYDFDDEEE